MHARQVTEALLLQQKGATWLQGVPADAASPEAGDPGDHGGGQTGTPRAGRVPNSFVRAGSSRSGAYAIGPLR